LAHARGKRATICHWHAVASMTSRIYIRLAPHKRQIGIRVTVTYYGWIDGAS
jgi:hypothetical protein